MKKSVIAVAVVLFATSILGTDGIEYLKNRNWFNSILITPTNMVFKFKDICSEVSASLTQQDGYEQRISPTQHIEKNKPLILPAGHTLCVSPTSHSPDRRGAMRLTPVVFKNQMNGFRITEVHYFGTEIKNIGYIALSKSPVEMGEEDVEMILLWKRNPSGGLYGAEWKTPEEILRIVLTERTAEPQPPAPTGMDVFDIFAGQLFLTVSITPTNMVLLIGAICYQVVLSRDPYIARSSKEYALNNEPLILTPDREVALMIEEGHYGASMIFEPVIFKSQRKGFRITRLYDYSPSVLGIVTNCIVYAALSDTYIRVRAEDVEMIMENGEWKPFEGNDKITRPPQRRDDPMTLTQDETSDTVVKYAQDEEKSNANIFFLYALIPLCLLAVLWVVKRKRKRDSP